MHTWEMLMQDSARESASAALALWGMPLRGFLYPCVRAHHLDLYLNFVGAGIKVIVRGCFEQPHGGRD